MSDAKPTVMIVENDSNIREGLALLLRGDGFEVIAESEAREALDKLRLHPEVRVILLDLMLFGMDGAGFRWAQLSEPALSQVPVILISAMSDVGKTAASLHAVDYFQKPIDLDRMLQSVRRFR